MIHHLKLFFISLININYNLINYKLRVLLQSGFNEQITRFGNISIPLRMASVF